MALGNTLFLFNPDNGPWADTETYVDEASGFSLAANSDSQIGQDFALTNYPGVGSGAVYVESNKDRHYATSPDSSLLPSAGKTYKLVIRRDDDGDACAMWVISDGTGNDGIRIGFTGSNRIRVYVFSGGVEYSVDTTVDTTVTSGEDAHIVITIPDPIGTPSIYLNGSSVSTSSFTATLTDGNALAIGSRATGSHSQGFDGAVYQAAVYDGAATSDEVLNNLYLGDRDASRSDSNPYTIFEAYRGIGYYSDSLLSRVPGTQENGVVDLGNLSGTIDRGSTDNILMPACRVNNLNFTLLGRLAVQGSGESDLLADISGTGTIDANGYGALPSALSPYSGNSNHTALRCSVLIDGITLTDSVSPAGNMFTHQALISDSPTVCLLHGVTATNADLDCISGKASGSMVGESASNTRMLLIGCNASNPGTASNNQAYTLHNGYHGYGWDNTFSGNTGGSDVAVSHVNDGTKDCQYNLTSFGSVGGITEWYGGFLI